MPKKVLISLLLAASVAYIAIDHQRVLVAFVICTPVAMILACVHALRINLLSGNTLGLSVALKGNSIALSANLLLPGRLSEILKPLYFNRIKSLPLAEGMSIVIVERALDVFAVACLVGGALYWMSRELIDFSDALKLAALALPISIAGAAFLALRFPDAILHVLGNLHHRVRPHAIDLFNALRRGTASGVSARQLALTGLAWMGAWFSYWLFLQFDGIGTLSLQQSLVIFLTATLGLAVTITPGGLGTFEAALVIVLQSMGYSIDSAIATAIGLRIVSLVPNATIAFYAVITDGLDLATMAKSAEKI